MKISTLITLSIVTLMLGCNHAEESEKNPPAADESSAVATMKISVFKDGRIKIDGEELSLEEAVDQILAASGSETQVFYYRESGQEEPHPNAMKIIAAVVEAKLPISLSTKPDFSTYVDEQGMERPRR